MKREYPHVGGEIREYAGQESENTRGSQLNGAGSEPYAVRRGALFQLLGTIGSNVAITYPILGDKLLF
jgi:hypothetical protein